MTSIKTASSDDIPGFPGVTAGRQDTHPVVPNPMGEPTLEKNTDQCTPLSCRQTFLNAWENFRRDGDNDPGPNSSSLSIDRPSQQATLVY